MFRSMLLKNQTIKFTNTKIIHQSNKLPFKSRYYSQFKDRLPHISNPNTDYTGAYIKNRIVTIQSQTLSTLKNNNDTSLISNLVKLARIDKPTGSYLLFLPCSWSILMATYSGAGCTINDLWDKNHDKKVIRTMNRPLASGAINSPIAVAFLAVQLSAGLVILLSLNTYSITLGFLSLPFVILYPLMKRITNWPQAFLGITFNWGVLMGWTSVLNSFNPTVLIPLYLSSIFWTLSYDTIYALQDRNCDLKAGIKSSALAVKGHTKLFLTVCATSHITLLALAGLFNSQSVPFYIVSCGGALFHYLWQIKTLKPTDSSDALAKFKSNVGLGFIITIGMIMDILYLWFY